MILSIFFWRSTEGGGSHTWFDWLWPSTAREIITFVEFCLVYIAKEKKLHHCLPTAISFRGSRAAQSLASVLHPASSCWRVMVSCRKTIPFRRFHSCQQQRRISVSKCAQGTWGGFGISCRELISKPAGTCTPIALQKLDATEHPNIMCAVVSACHGTSVRRGDGVVITLVAIAFGILLVAVISCVGPRPLCNGHISQTCEQEKVTNKWSSKIGRGIIPRSVLNSGVSVSLTPRHLAGGHGLLQPLLSLHFSWDLTAHVVEVMAGMGNNSVGVIGILI